MLAQVRLNSRSRMRFIDVPALRHITNVMSHLDCGDQRLDARIELYVYDGVLNASPSLHPMSSPGLHPAGSPSSHRSSHPKDIHSMMVSILNDAFPDYQFNRLSPDHFALRTDSASVVNAVNQTLGCVVERSHPGLLEELWQVLRQTIDLPASEIYELVHDAMDDSKLWSFTLFWHDQLSSKVLLFSCRSKSKLFHHSSSSESGFDSRSSKWSSSSHREDFAASSADGMSDSEY
jgi:hypothetical protein